MNIVYKSFGLLQTNCYLISNKKETIVIDPGENSINWIKDNIPYTPIGIINTHGHYDHVYSNSDLKEYFNIPIIIHEDDDYLLSNDEFKVNLPKSKSDFSFSKDLDIHLGKFSFKAISLPGHSHGTSIYDFGNFIISGDFVMDKTIGRYNLPTSNKDKQYQSLLKYLNLYETCKEATHITVYSGHGKPFSLEESLDTVRKWLTFF